MTRIFMLCVVIVLVLAATAMGQTLVLHRSAFGSGGGALVGSTQELGFTVGQAVSGVGSTGDETASAGFWGWTDITTGVNDGHAPEKLQTELQQNYPNPFNPVTRVPYSVGSEGAVHVKLHIYDVRGGLVATLVDGLKPPGTYTALWEGLNNHGTPVASGIYFVRFAAGSYTITRKLVLLK